jgi:hypothetical protein
VSTERQTTGSFRSFIAPAIKKDSSGLSSGGRKHGQRVAEIKAINEKIKVVSDNNNDLNLLLRNLFIIMGDKAKSKNIRNKTIIDNLYRFCRLSKSTSLFSKNHRKSILVSIYTPIYLGKVLDKLDQKLLCFKYFYYILI